MGEKKEKMEEVGRKEAYTYRQRERGWNRGGGSGGEGRREERRERLQGTIDCGTELGNISGEIMQDTGLFGRLCVHFTCQLDTVQRSLSQPSKCFHL